MSDWIQTYTGKKFYPLDPKEEDICIEDIAHALSLTCRFGGHCSTSYSVAQHSIIVSRLVPDHLRLAALLHDASEAYLCDIPSPVKKDPRFSFYREAECALMKVIFRKFDVPDRYLGEIKFADEEVFSLEAWSLFPEERVKEWKYARADTGDRITPVSSSSAETAFLEYFEFLSKMR